MCFNYCTKEVVCSSGLARETCSFRSREFDTIECKFRMESIVQIVQTFDKNVSESLAAKQ